MTTKTSIRRAQAHRNKVIALRSRLLDVQLDVKDLRKRIDAIGEEAQSLCIGRNVLRDPDQLGCFASNTLEGTAGAAAGAGRGAGGAGAPEAQAMTRGRHAIGAREAQIYVAHANGASYREIGAHFGISISRARELDLIVQRKIERRWHFFQAARTAWSDRLPLKEWEGRQ